MIRNGYAMGVAAEILEHILRAAEGWLRVQPPSPFGTVAVAMRRRSSAERGVSGFREKRVVDQRKACFESSDKLAAEDTTEYVNGKKEPIA